VNAWTVSKKLTELKSGDRFWHPERDICEVPLTVESTCNEFGLITVAVEELDWPLEFAVDSFVQLVGDDDA
jgi:hypothetical protein